MLFDVQNGLSQNIEDNMKFDYFEPTTIKEAVTLLQQYGDKARVIAGGTDLVSRMKDRKIDPGYVISLGRIKEVDGIEQETDGIRIGALTTISTLEKSTVLKSKYSAVAQAASQMASPGIRNMATVGGSLCSASPSGDMAPALMVLDARARIESPAGTRELPLSEFFAEPWSTVLIAGEILVSVYLPEPRPGNGSAYLKYAARENDLAIVGAGAAMTIEDGVCRSARLALAAVAPTPIRARRAEAFLEGKRIGESEMEQAGKLTAEEAKPRQGSVRVNPEYRCSMVAVFVRRAIAAAIKHAGGIV
jgi:CO/xanthine dehydrogenase FAD-binding subunit